MLENEFFSANNISQRNLVVQFICKKNTILREFEIMRMCNVYIYFVYVFYSKELNHKFIKTFKRNTINIIRPFLSNNFF